MNFHVKINYRQMNGKLRKYVSILSLELFIYFNVLNLFSEYLDELLDTQYSVRRIDIENGEVD